MNKNTCKIVREVLTFYRDFVSEAEEIDGRQKAAPGKQMGVIVPLADVIREDLDSSQILVQMQSYSAEKSWIDLLLLFANTREMALPSRTGLRLALWQLRFMESLDFCINVSKKIGRHLSLTTEMLVSLSNMDSFDLSVISQHWVWPKTSYSAETHPAYRNMFCLQFCLDALKTHYNKKWHFWAELGLLEFYKVKKSKTVMN